MIRNDKTPEERKRWKELAELLGLPEEDEPAAQGGDMLSEHIARLASVDADYEIIAYLGKLGAISTYLGRKRAPLLSLEKSRDRAGNSFSMSQLRIGGKASARS